MMATSVVGMGVTGKSIPVISSSHSSSLHEPSIVAPSSDTNNSPEGQNQYAKSEDSRMLFIHPELSPLSSSSGKQLALSSSQGREASPAPLHSGVQEDETDIALTQLRELDIAIEVRKVTKVDGRKTRWIEYRKNRGTVETSFIKEEEGEEEQDNSLELISSKSKKKAKGKKSIQSGKEKLSLDINENSSPIKSKIVLNNSTNNSESVIVEPDTEAAVNNNNNLNNNNNSVCNMKIETNSSTVNPLGTNNVLETMKHQFLQGTVNLQENSANGVKIKLGKKSKVINGSSGTENLKRKPGRPKKTDSLKLPLGSSSPVIKKEMPDLVETLSSESNLSSLNVETNGSDVINTAKKIEMPLGNVGQSTTDFYPKKFFITKGLREVRKSESGSESGASSPDKIGTPTGTCPSTPLPVSPILCPLSIDHESSGVIKIPSVAISDNDSTFISRKKKLVKKSSKKENINLSPQLDENMTVNGPLERNLLLYKIVHQNQDSEVKSLRNEEIFIARKRGRGRPKTDENEIKFSKKISTVIVDVHNTMNGEPQTVIPIPVNNSATKKKKKQSPKRTSTSTHIEISNKGNESNVPNDLHTSEMLISPTESSDKFVNFPSASKFVINDSLENSDSTNNKSGVIEEQKRLQNTLAHISPDFSEKSRPLEITKSNDTISVSTTASISNNNIILDSLSTNNSIKTARKSLITTYRPIAMKPQGLKKAPSTIIVSTSEAIKKTNQEKKLSLSMEVKNFICSVKDQNVIAEISKSNEADVAADTSQHILNNSKNVVIAPKSTEKDPSILYRGNKPASKNQSIDAIIEKLQSPAIKKLNETSLEGENMDNLNLKSLNKFEFIPNSENSEKAKPDNLIILNADNSSKLKGDFVPKLRIDNSSKLNVDNSLNLIDNASNLIDNISNLKINNTTNLKSDNANLKINIAPKLKINIAPKLKINTVPKLKINTVHKLKIGNGPKLKINPLKLKVINPSKLNTDTGIAKKSIKDKNKVPRFLKQLFQDEGVQNMLRSVYEEIPGGSTNLDSGNHKLRPKKVNENIISDSPEPDDGLCLPNVKKKKKINESDSLFLEDESISSLSNESVSKRSTSIDGSVPVDSPNISLKNIKLNKINSDPTVDTELETLKKRKLNDLTDCNNVVNYAKKLKTEFKSKPELNGGHRTIQEGIADEIAKKKLVKQPVNVSLKQKTKVPIEVQLRRQLIKLGIQQTNLNISQMRELLSKANNLPMSHCQPGQLVKIKTSFGEVNKQIPKIHQTSPSSVNPLQNNLIGPKRFSNQPKNMQPIMSLMRPLDNSNFNSKGKSRPLQEGIRQSQRASVRQSDGNHHYRDISIRKYNYFIQIILTPSTTKMKNSLNSRVLKELCDALQVAKRDETVRMVLITGTGSTFCQGIDLTSLQHPNQETRKKNAENLTRGIKEFLRALVQFPKILIAGVNGDAMGLGVTMLPLFDSVIASDKAQFYLPYSKLGQVPEGGATYTFPYNYGKLPSLKLFEGYKITAMQALQMGLVSESLWPNTFLQELIPKVGIKSSIPTQGLEATKALMNHHLVTKLELSIESENRLLLQHWTSANFFNSCKRFLDTYDIPFQKPVSLPPY